MFIHNVFIANSFEKGDRFAYDIVIPAEDMGKELDESQRLRDFLVGIYNELGGDTTITTHVIPTKSKDWNSVVERDTFFSDIKIIKSEKNFIKNLSYNVNLTYYDIFYLVISLLDDNSLDIDSCKDFVEKINLEYLKQYNEDLYEEKAYKKYGHMSVENIKKYSNIIVDRVLSANNGPEKYNFVYNNVKTLLSKHVIE